MYGLRRVSLLVVLLSLVAFAVVMAQTPGSPTPTSTTDQAPAASPTPTPTPEPLSKKQKNAIRRILRDPILKKANVSVLVKNVRTAETLFSKNPDTFCLPASTNKLVTGAAALSILGPKYRFTTMVKADSRPNDYGVINGNLYLIGGGDPHLTMEQVWMIAHRLRIAGVHKVTGDLVGDDSFHDQVRFYEDWGEQTRRAYHASLGALSVNFNTLTLWVLPAAKVGEPARVTIEPMPPWMTLRGQIKTVEGAGAKYYLSLRNGTATVSGTVGRWARPDPTYHAVRDPLSFALSAFRDAMRKEGIEIVGKNRAGLAPDKSKLIYEHESEQLSLILRQLFRFSNNFTAEQIQRTIGAVKFGAPGTRKKGVRAEMEWLKSNDLAPPGVVVFDGSGLSRKNRQSAGSLVGILHHMARRPEIFAEYLEAQPIAGVDGTLRYRFKRTNLIGRVRAKTGLLNGVISLAGYCYDSRNELYSFAVLINNYLPTVGVRGPQRLTEQLLDVLMQ